MANKPSLADQMRTKREAKAARANAWPPSPEAYALLKAAEGIRDDLLMRAEFEGGEKIVACGCGAWRRLNDAIDAFKKLPRSNCIGEQHG